VIEAPPKPRVFLDLPQLFARTAPVHVDLGCGDGSFLRALAASRPNTNFLGIERLLHRVRSSDRKAQELENVRIVRAETMFVLRHLLPPDSVEAFYLLFPDPWPKRRHHRRRLVTTGFLEAVAGCLTIDGSLFIATDHDDYFAAICRALSNTVELAIADSDWNLPPTTFEKKFVAAGTGIHRIEFRKVSPVT
jgi:tRNA (guanine-N7-)-methyltransferase